jgi:hypothetical protein
MRKGRKKRQTQHGEASEGRCRSERGLVGTPRDRVVAGIFGGSRDTKDVVGLELSRWPRVEQGQEYSLPNLAHTSVNTLQVRFRFQASINTLIVGWYSETNGMPEQVDGFSTS